MDDEKLRKVRSKQEREDKKRYHEKMENYAKFVKEMHWPELSQRKQQEMEKMKQLMENWNRP